MMRSISRPVSRIRPKAPAFRNPSRTNHERSGNARTFQLHAQSEQALVPLSAKSKLIALLAQGYSNYVGREEVGEAVKALLKEQSEPQPDRTSPALGQGVWEVFWAPHIASISSATFTKFEPLRYVYKGDTLVSNVLCTGPFGKAWLSAAGTMKPIDSEAVQIHFDRFWVDSGTDLRPDIDPNLQNVPDIDRIMSLAGRPFFFPQLAVFPVLYLDDEIAVFRFPPLNSMVGIRKTDVMGIWHEPTKR